MKKLILLTVFVLFLGSISILAQRNGNRGPGQNRVNNTNTQNRVGTRQNRANRQGKRGNNNAQRQRNRRGKIFRGLDLSDEQRQQIRDINSSARENGTDRETVINQVRGVLTDDQLETFNERLERARQRQERRQQRRQQRQQNQNNQNQPPPPPSNNGN